MDLLKILDGTPEPPIIDLHLKDLNTSGSYELATPMYEFQKELTDQIVSLHYPDILKFCETDSANDLILKSLEICYQNCILVSIHPYLLIKHYMPKNLTLKDILNKLAETSGKFNVLKDLMNVIIHSNNKRDKHIGIVMNNAGKVFDLVEALLLGCTGGTSKIIKRYVGNSVKKESKARGASNGGSSSTSSSGGAIGGVGGSSAGAGSNNNNSNNNGAGGGTTGNGTAGAGAGAGAGGPGRKKNGTTFIHLIPGDENHITRDVDVLKTIEFDLVVIFDSNVDPESEFVKKIRTQNNPSALDGGVGCCSIKLIPLKTIEHVQLHYYGQDKTTKSYLYKLISAIVCLREQIGILPPDLFPIYNQNLKYLGGEFFDKLLDLNDVQTRNTFPAWPLPELPRIPYFNAADVEKSLLTEVHYHYTPYDTAEIGGGSASSNSNLYNPSSFYSNGTSGSSKQRKPTYYETKKIEQNYVTNPNKNDMNILSGIIPIGPTSYEVALTHKLIMRMNTTFIFWKNIEQEHDWYVKERDFDNTGDPTNAGNSVRTRLSDTKRSLLAIVNDVNHAKSRISSAEKRFQRQSGEIDQLKERIATLEIQLSSFLKEFNVSSLKLTMYYENQLKIWSLQQEIQESLDKIISKQEEKSYIQNEYQNATNSINDFQNQIEKINEDNELLKRKIHEVEEQQEVKLEEFKKQRQVFLEQLSPERERSQALKIKLGKSWKFLKNTSHLKKRKGRGATPGR